jgi:prepilin-type processing-associated H-X9-DG protein
VKLLSAAAVTACLGGAGVVLFGSEISDAPAGRRFWTCRLHLRVLGQALQLYHRDYGVFPPNLKTLVAQDRSAARELQCPYDQRPDGAGYDYKHVAGLTIEDPADWIIAFEDPPPHGRGLVGANMLYPDGHVEFRAAAALRQELAQFPRRAHQAGKELVDEVTSFAWSLDSWRHPLDPRTTTYVTRSRLREYP